MSPVEHPRPWRTVPHREDPEFPSTLSKITDATGGWVIYPVRNRIAEDIVRAVNAEWRRETAPVYVVDPSGREPTRELPPGKLKVVQVVTRDLRHYTPLYIAEACWKYNHRKDDNSFGLFMRGCFA